MSWPWESKAAVDARFYAQIPTAFTVTRADTWRGPGFKVNNLDNGAARMRVQTETADSGNGNLRSLVLLDDATHGQIAAVKESRLGITRQRQWEAFRGRGGGESGTDRLFVAVDKTGLVQSGITVHVFLDGVNSSGDRVPDFVVQGSFYHGAMTVSRGGVTGGDAIALIQNDSGLYDTLIGFHHSYTAWINREVDQAFVLALAVILDQMYTSSYNGRYCDHSSDRRW
ncbi:unnamed protein product [Alopecurus aequalis]